MEALNDNRRMMMRLMTFAVWAAVAASALAWGLRLGARSQALPAQATVAAAALPAQGDLTRLFGAPAVEAVEAAPVPAADARFKLLGVVAPRAGQHAGLALIAVDGKPPRALAVGERVDGDLKLLSVSHRRVELGSDGTAALALELPPVPEPSRGAPAAATSAAPMPAVRAPVAPQPASPGDQQVQPVQPTSDAGAQFH